MAETRTPPSPSPILAIENLKTVFHTDDGTVRAADVGASGSNYNFVYIVG